MAKHRGRYKDENVFETIKMNGVKHITDKYGKCSLLCNCPTPLTSDEVGILDSLGLF